MARDTGRHAAGRGIGAYLLGALDRPEQARVAAHLARCAICRRAVADLVDLPALLALVSPRDVLAPPGDGSPVDPGPGPSADPQDDLNA